MWLVYTNYQYSNIPDMVLFNAVFDKEEEAKEYVNTLRINASGPPCYGKGMEIKYIKVTKMRMKIKNPEFEVVG